MRERNSGRNEIEYQPFSNNTEYCDRMYAERTEIESKHLCYEMVEQPLGPEKCFEI